MLRGESLGRLQAMDLEGDVVFRPACKMGLEGDCLETAGIALQIRTLVGLVGIQKSQCSRREARARGGLGSGDVSGTRIVDWC